MIGTRDSAQAVIFRRQDHPKLYLELLQFRKALFADYLGWRLQIDGALERDEFDHAAAEYCALLVGDEIAGCFRAIRCDAPYLARHVFSDVVPLHVFPSGSDAWEISRFGVLPARSMLGTALYAVMFEFAARRGARVLPALVDLQHERLLRRMNIQTRRYSGPRVIGRDVRNRPIRAVAGEIPIDLQRAHLASFASNYLGLVEITDETADVGSDRISA